MNLYKCVVTKMPRIDCGNSIAPQSARGSRLHQSLNALDEDDSEDDIKLDGAITRGSEEEFSEEEGGGEPGDDDEEKDGPGSQAGADQQTLVDINLDFCDPHERFFHGIKCVVVLLSGPHLLLLSRVLSCVPARMSPRVNQADKTQGMIKRKMLAAATLQQRLAVLLLVPQRCTPRTNTHKVLCIWSICPTEYQHVLGDQVFVKV